jgi:hypothetical protein
VGAFSIIGAGTGVGVGVGVGVAVATGVGVGVATGFGFGIATPLFQTNFLPLLMQVNFLPFVVAVTPAFLQLSPALTAATAFKGVTRKATDNMTASNFFIYED